MLKSYCVLVLLLLLNYIVIAAQVNESDSLVRMWQQEGSTISVEKQQSLLKQIAKSYMYSNPDSAIYYGRLLLESAQSVQNQSIENEAYNMISRANYVAGNVDESYKYASRVLDLSEKIGDIKGQTAALVAIGLVYLSQLNHAVSEEYFLKALKLATSNNDSINMAKASLNLSISLEERGELDAALDYSIQSIEISKSSNNNRILIMGYNRKGSILYNLEEYAKSILNHQLALEIMDPNNQWELCFTYSSLSKPYFSMQEYTTSLDYGLRSLKLAKSMDAKWEAILSTQVIADTYYAMGDFKNAYLYAVQNKNYFETVFTENKEREINKLHLDISASEKLVLERDISHQQELISQRNIQLLLLSIALIAFLILIIVLVINRGKRLEYTKKIAAQRDELEVMGKSKDKILSIIAHDMRSPMSSILGILYLISEADSSKEKEELEKHYKELYQRVTDVNFTLDNLLLWAMAQFKETKAHPENTDVLDVVNQQIEICAYDAKQKGITVDFEPNKNLNAQAFVDIGHARIVVRNLLSNAIKFTRANGLIHIDLETTKNQILLTISDDGVGISQDKVAHLFSGTIDSTSGTHNEVGTGLGLSICNEYVQLNGGTISVESEEGRGTTFTIMLPLST